MRSGQTTNLPAHHRVISFRIVVTLLVVSISLAWLVKGSGMKSWVVQRVLPPPGQAHVDGGGALSGRVRLPSAPMVGFGRIALPPTAGTTFTCVRVGPDGKLYAGAIDGRIFRFVI